MTPEQISGIAWPAAVLIVGLAALFMFRSAIRGLINRSNEADVLGVRLTAKDLERSAEISALSVERQMRQGDPGPDPEMIRQLARSVAKIVGDRISRKWPATNVLWLHADPNHDQLEQIILREMGMQVTMCTTLSDAIRNLEADGDVQICISNMGSVDENIGFRFFEEFRSRGTTWRPFILYTRRAKDPGLRQEATRLGIFACASSANEFFEVVGRAADSVSR